jgi:protein O-mannosyl-transferase
MRSAQRTEKVRGATAVGVRASVAAIVIAIAGVAAYSNSFRGVFAFDDRSAIALNPAVRTLWPLTDAMNAPRDTALAGRPVASLSFALSYALAPTDARDTFATRAGDPAAADRLQRNAWGYHAGNLVIHLLSALALFGVVRRTLGAPALVARFGSHANDLALAIAAIWVVHPLTTASVTYIVQRTEALMGLLYLATLYCAIRALDDHGPPEGGHYDRPKSRDDDHGPPEGGHYDRPKSRDDGHGPPEGGHRDRTNRRDDATYVVSAFRRTFWSNAAIVFCALAMGTKEAAATAPLMVVLWDFLMLEGPWRAVLARRWRLYAGLAATWALLVVIMMFAPRSASVGFGLQGVSPWAYLITQAGVIAHYLRLAFVPWPLSLDYEWPIARSLRDVLPPALLVLALLGATVWGLMRRAPSSFAGVWFFLLLAPTSSIVPIVTEVAADHRMYLPLVSLIAFTVLGAVFVCTDRASDRSGRHGLKAVPYSSLRIAGFAISAVLVVVLGILTHARNEDYSSQERLYGQTVATRPSNARARSNLASVLIDQGRAKEAEPLLREAIRLKPDYADAYANLGVAYVVQGRLEDALGPFEKAVALAPDSPSVWRNYGETLGSVGRYAEAAHAFRKVLPSSPDDPDLLEGLAWILATAPDAGVRDGRAAVDLAQSAARLSREGTANVLDTLGAAYAENGQFAEATAAARRALTLARDAGQSDLVSQIELRLRWYENRQPYREPAR